MHVSVQDALNDCYKFLCVEKLGLLLALVSYNTVLYCIPEIPLFLNRVNPTVQLLLLNMWIGLTLAR
jgi:hypothetical protein